MDTSSDSIRAVGEADLLEVARVARSTWRNWIGQGLVEEPGDGLYREHDVVEAVVVALLVGCLDLRRAKGIWLPARTATVDRCSALPLTASPSLHAVVDLHTWEMHLATGAPELFAAVNPTGGFPRGFVVVALSAVVLDARRAFWMRAAPAAELTKDRRRRARRQQERSRRPAAS